MAAATAGIPGVGAGASSLQELLRGFQKLPEQITMQNTAESIDSTLAAYAAKAKPGDILLESARTDLRPDKTDWMTRWHNYFKGDAQRNHSYILMPGSDGQLRPYLVSDMKKNSPNALRRPWFGSILQDLLHGKKPDFAKAKARAAKSPGRLAHGFSPEAFQKAVDSTYPLRQHLDGLFRGRFEVLTPKTPLTPVEFEKLQEGIRRASRYTSIEKVDLPEAALRRFFTPVTNAGSSSAYAPMNCASGIAAGYCGVRKAGNPSAILPYDLAYNRDFRSLGQVNYNLDPLTQQQYLRRAMRAAGPRALVAAPLLLTAGLLTRSALKGVGKSHGTPMEKIIRDWRETGQIDISKLPRNNGSWLNQSKN
jgi:hypothetical protein